MILPSVLESDSCKAWQGQSPPNHIANSDYAQTEKTNSPNSSIFGACSICRVFSSSFGFHSPHPVWSLSHPLFSNWWFYHNCSLRYEVPAIRWAATRWSRSFKFSDIFSWKRRAWQSDTTSALEAYVTSIHYSYLSDHQYYSIHKGGYLEQKLLRKSSITNSVLPALWVTNCFEDMRPH